MDHRQQKQLPYPEKITLPNKLSQTVTCRRNLEHRTSNLETPWLTNQHNQPFNELQTTFATADANSSTPSISSVDGSLWLRKYVPKVPSTLLC